MERVLVIGVGNPLRGDDAAGLAVAGRLKGRLPGVAVREQIGEAASLATSWDGFERVVIVDAVRSGAVPGTIHRLDARRPLPAAFGSLSSHGLGVASALELARALGSLPRRTRVYGIEGQSFELGEGLSAAATAGVEALVAQLLAELAREEP